MAGGAAQVPGPGGPGAALEQAQHPGLEGTGASYRHVAVLAPFRDVSRHIVEPVAVGRKGAHRRGEQEAVLGGAVVMQIGPEDPPGVRGLTPPGIGLAREAPPGGGLPLGLGGELMLHPGDLTQPPAKGRGVVPGHSHHRLVGGAQVFVLPVQGRPVPRGLKKPGVLGVGDLGDPDIEGLQTDPVERGFIGVAAGLVGRRPQEIDAPGDEGKLEALGLYYFLGLGGPEGQQQPAKQQEQKFGFLAVSLAETVSNQAFRILHMDHLY